MYACDVDITVLGYLCNSHILFGFPVEYNCLVNVMPHGVRIKFDVNWNHSQSKSSAC